MIPYRNHARRHAPGGTDPISGDGIKFNVDNEGGWLDITANDVDANGYGIDLKNAAAGDFLIESVTGATLIHGPQGNELNLDAEGSITLQTDGGASNPTIDIESVGQLTILSHDATLLESVGQLTIKSGAAPLDFAELFNDGTNGGWTFILPDPEQYWFTINQIDDVGTNALFLIQQGSPGTNDLFSFYDTSGNLLMQIRNDGTYHIKTGATWTADL